MFNRCAPSVHHQIDIRSRLLLAYTTANISSFIYINDFLVAKLYIKIFFAKTAWQISWFAPHGQMWHSRVWPTTSITRTVAVVGVYLTIASTSARARWPKSITTISSVLNICLSTEAVFLSITVFYQEILLHCQWMASARSGLSFHGNLQGMCEFSEWRK